jgi:hypothetical protein
MTKTDIFIRKESLHEKAIYLFNYFIYPIKFGA